MSEILELKDLVVGDGGPTFKAPANQPALGKTIADIEAGRPPSWQLNWKGQPMTGNEPPITAGNEFDLSELVVRGEPTRASGGPIGQPGRPLPVSEAASSAGKNFLAGTASLLDFPLSFPGFTLGVATNLGATLTGALAKPWTGESWKEVYKSGRNIGGEVAEKFTNPLQKILRIAGLEKEYENQPAVKAMEAVMGWIEEGGERVEQLTKGGIPKEAVQTLAEVGMISGLPGAKGVLDKVRGAAGKFEDWLAKRKKVEEAPPESLDAILRAYDAEGGNSADLRKTTSVADLNRMVQKALNAEKTARELVDKNAPLAKVEKAVKSNPLVGRKIDEILKERRAFRSGEMARGVLQGEVLPPDQLPAPQRGGKVDPKLLAKLGLATGAGLVAADQWDEMTDEQRSLLMASGLVLAVKGKGGAWDPRAVDRLGDSLYPQASARALNKAYFQAKLEKATNELDRLTYEDAVESITRAEHALRMARNYLNKHAGTEGDPLRQIPFRDTNWGEMFDYQIWDDPSAQGPVWNFSTPNITNLGAALPHLRDFLDTIPTEKLPNYDLPRLVREMHEQDIQIAKQALKEALKEAQAASPWRVAGQDALPTVREYKGESLPARKFEINKEGSKRQMEAVDLPAETTDLKWVAFEKPERLTPEQAKMVRPFEELKGAGGADLFVALDEKGKPLINRFTEEYATGKTPEEAWLAGQLAGEGNFMGHCVGGYCGSVLSGDSQIFGLRDAKGRSLATIELRQPEIGNPVVQQIKGPGNGTIEPAYRKYVQDFLNSREWGQVKDLDLAGLVDKGSRAPAGKRFQPAENWDKQAGKAAPELLVNLAVGMGGAVLGAAIAQDKQAGAFLGGLAALGLFRGKSALNAFSKTGAARVAENLGGLISTSLLHESQSLWGRAVKMEKNILQNTHRAISATAGFAQGYRKLSGPVKERLKLGLLNNNLAEIEAAIKASGDPALAKGWVEARKVLNAYGAALKGSDRIARLREEYFPRIVTDYKGLVEALGRTHKEAIEKLIAAEEKQSLRSSGHPLTEIDISAIINRYMRQLKGPLISEPGFAKGRQVDLINRDLAQYYADPLEALHTYLRRATTELEKNRLFGRDLSIVRKGERRYVNIDDSIGNLTRREVTAGRMSPEVVPRVRELLRSRFVGGEQAPSQFVQAARNLTYLGLLGDITSGIIQFGDTIAAGALFDMRPTLEAVVRNLTGRPLIRMKDLGLADHIVEEFASTSRSSKWLKTVLKPVFSQIDKFGKNTVLNAALIQGRRLASTERGVQRLMSRYGQAWGEEMPALLQDLRAGRVTPHTELYAFHELSRMQPISKLEMPKAYLDHPNGRYFYTLHSYQLKQLDLLRREAYDQIKAGNTSRGLYNLAKLGLVMGIAGALPNMVVNFILGRPMEPAEWGTIVDNLFKTYGWSRITQDAYDKKGPGAAFATMVAPPWKMFDDIWKMKPEAVQYLPFFGKTIYYNVLGGAEKAQAAAARREDTPRKERLRERREARQ